MNIYQSLWTQEEEMEEDIKDYQWFKHYDQENLKKELESLYKEYEKTNG